MQDFVFNTDKQVCACMLSHVQFFETLCTVAPQALCPWDSPSKNTRVGCFNISPSNEHPELISFRMDWLDLLTVQGTLKSLLKHHSSKVSILLCSTFFIAQLSHPYMATGKTIALTRQTFVDKVMSLFF